MMIEDVVISFKISKRTIKLSLVSVSSIVVFFILFYILSPTKWQNAVVQTVKQAAINPGAVNVDFLCYTKGFVGSPTLYEKMPAVCAVVGRKLMAFTLNKDNTEAEFTIKEVDATILCERICQYQAWSSRRAGEKLAFYSDSK